MSGERERVSGWLEHFVEQLGYGSVGEGVLHGFGDDGPALLEADVRWLLGATKPKPKRQPSLPAAERRVQRTGQATSLWAATEVCPEGAQTLYRRIQRLLWVHPLTDEQLVRGLEESWPGEHTPSGVRSRRSELVEAGWVVNTGKKGITRGGHATIIWGLADSK